MTLSVFVSPSGHEHFTWVVHKVMLLWRPYHVSGFLVEGTAMVQSPPLWVPCSVASQSSGYGWCRSCLSRDVVILLHIDFLSTALSRRMSPGVVSYILRGTGDSSLRQHESFWILFLCAHHYAAMSQDVIFIFSSLSVSWEMQGNSNYCYIPYCSVLANPLHFGFNHQLDQRQPKLFK